MATFTLEISIEYSELFLLDTESSCPAVFLRHQK